MSATLRWDGAFLREPVAAVPCDGSWYAMSVGPSSAAPFDEIGFHLRFDSVAQGHLYLFGEAGRPMLLKDKSCRIRIINRQDPSTPRPVEITIRPTDFKLHDSRTAKISVATQLKGHIESKSDFELFVLRDEGPVTTHPSLIAAVHPTTDYLNDLAVSPLPFDVRFSFPRSGQDLWANSAVLKKASPYFKTQLEFDFAKGSSEVVNYTGATTHPDSASDLDFSDSDDEEVAHDPTTPAKPQSKIHTITISNYSFNTYHAVWVWIITNEITFAPLVPNLVDSSSTTSQTAPKRRKVDATAAPPAAPPAVSLKSVYRLAHLLELEPLKKDALKAFKRGLTVDNAACQLFSSTSRSYDDVRATAAKFVAKHWEAVGKTESMKRKMAELEADEVPRAGPIMLALTTALMVARTPVGS